MHRGILRSIAAILSGWVVAVGGYVATMIVIALLNREVFRPDVQLSAGWWLVTLSVGCAWSVAAGFVAGVIAQRREIAHAIGLVLFGLLVCACWPRGRGPAMSVPDWYWVAAYVLGVPTPVFGGWLRARQDVLVRRIPASVVGAFCDVRRLVTKGVARFRFLIAVVVSGLTFLIGMRLGVLALGAGLLVVRRYFGGVLRGDIFALPVVLIVMFLLPILLSAHVYRRIMARDSTLRKAEE